MSSKDCVAVKDWDLIQGATFDKLLLWINPRSIFIATVGGDSDVTAPIWPPDIGDTIVDNTVTWENVRLATIEDLEGVAAIAEWLPSTAYALNAIVLSTRQPVDITGYSARLQIRDEFADDPDSIVLFEMTTVIDADDNGIRLGTTDGDIRLTIQPATTETFDFGSAGYDLEMIAPVDPPLFPDGFVTRLLEGKFIVSKERTRDTATVTTP